MKTNAMVFASLFSLAMFAHIDSAHATTSITVPNGTAVIGVIKDASGIPSVVAVTQDPSGGCHRNTIVSNYGTLLDNTQVHGSSSGDFITIFQTGTQPSAWCGYVVYPLTNFNGWVLDLFGDGGGDWVFGGTSDTYVYGEAGNDSLTVSTYPWDRAYGGDGDDVVDGKGSNTAAIYGENGNDKMDANALSNAARVNVMDGGPGTDAFCGWAVTTFTNVETLASGCQ